jgi:CHAT domain-containing protein
LTDGAHYLGEEYTLFTLPSANALRFIQEKRKPQANTILALGDPAISEPGLPPLRFAEKEAEDIARLFGTPPLTGASATESALRSQASNAGIVHLAAHGAYNPDNALFSTVYLTGDAQNDGRLEVNEVYSLDLTKLTDLVVLSACETDLGVGGDAVSKGDEIVGLNRAFIYAGTPTVIASLWSVDDNATALLMKQFYTHLRAGLSKAEALQQAQRDVRATHPHPYYWAAFVLTGDPGTANTVPSPALSPRPVLIVILTLCILAAIGAAFLLLVGALILRRRRSPHAPA